MIEMNVQGITLDPVTNMPIVILRGKETDHVLPIWIGIFEANAIAMQLEGITRPRPMTHDLINSIINSLNGVVEYIYIHDLRDNTYYAEISIKTESTPLKIDARPSDAINIALRSGAPIFVSEEVLQKSQSDESKLDASEEEIKEWLESIKPEDFESSL
ncbi:MULTISPECIES: bifunctional nuclease family protein [unclassified Persephonella]|uniref:bifunctional nuclease family protein n=1 Tax=unclassified Persephonella TaxID=2641955 RepID=UPI0004981433|nr:bifunctional nuclease family protein [Persephonella sp. KM09-Lau-8]